MLEREVTGRDGLLIREALATAIVTLGQLPANRQPSSNIEDMKLILAELCGGQRIAQLLAEAEIRTAPADTKPWHIWRRYGFDEMADGLEKLARDSGEETRS